MSDDNDIDNDEQRIEFTCGRCGAQWKQVRAPGEIIMCRKCRCVSLIGFDSQAHPHRPKSVRGPAPEIRRRTP